MPETKAEMNAQKWPMQAAGAVLFLFLLGYCLYWIHAITIGATTLEWSSYSYSDLLISYNQGFVRKGLIGEIILAITAGRSALPVTNAILFWNFVLLAVCLSIMALRTRLRAWTAVFIIAMPGSFLCMVVTRAFFTKKEFFADTALALMGMAILYLQKMAGGRAKSIFAYTIICTICMLSIVLSLVHDSFLFLAAPAAFFLLMAAVRCLPATSLAATVTVRRITASYFGALLLLFLGMEGFNSSPVAAVRMWQALNPIDRFMITSDGRLSGGMGLFTLKHIDLLFHPFTKVQDGTAWYWLAPAAALAIYCLTLVAVNQDKAPGRERNYRKWIICYLTLACVAAPMFAIGEDWGRWLFSFNISFLTLWLSIEPENLVTLHGSAIPHRMLSTEAGKEVGAQISNFSAYYLRYVDRHWKALCGIMLAFAFTYRMPEAFIEETLPYLISYSARFVNHSLMHFFHMRNLAP